MIRYLIMNLPELVTSIKSVYHSCYFFNHYRNKITTESSYHVVFRERKPIFFLSFPAKVAEDQLSITIAFSHIHVH